MVVGMTLSTEQTKQLAGELTVLSEQQFTVLQQAIYFPMTRDEAMSYGQRATRMEEINRLLNA